MGGGGSQGGFQPGQFTAIDPDKLAQFRSTSQGQTFDSSKYDALGGSNGIGYYAAQGGGYTNQGVDLNNAGLASNGGVGVGDIVDAFNQWNQQNDQEATTYKDYTDAVKNQPGIGQTILTGPQSGALTPSVLGG